MLDQAPGAARARRRPPARRAHPHRRPRRSSRPGEDLAWVRSSARSQTARPRLRDPRHPRRPGPRPGDRRGRHADLAVDDVRPGRGRRAPGLRVLPHRQPDPRRARGVPRLARGRRATASRSPAGWPPRTTSCALLRPGDRDPARQRRLRRHVPPDRQGVRARRLPVDARSTSPTSTRSTRHGPTTRGWSGSRRRPTRCSRASTSRRSPRVAHDRGALVRRRQHVRHAVPAAAARARRRRRRALGDEVPRRPLRRGRRLRRRSTTTSSPSALRFIQNAAGAVPAPFDCYLVLRGVKTLAVRMERHCANARADRRPARRPPRGRPGALPAAARPSRPRRGGASRCATSAGWCRFTLRGGEAAALEVVRHTELFTLAESLGAVESLIEHPGRMTHASAAGSPLEVDRQRWCACRSASSRRRPRRRPRAGPRLSLRPSV